MRRSLILVPSICAALLIGSVPGSAQALSKDGAKQKFSGMVREQIGRKSRGSAKCAYVKRNRFRCTGRWQRLLSQKGVRIKLIVRTRGGAFEDPEKVRSWARLTKWKITRGVKRGPFQGAFLMSTDYKPNT